MNAAAPLFSTKKRILIIEDDADIRSSLIELLDDQGYEVSSANNGQEGIDILRKGPLPDLILLDLMMPIKDGFAFRADQISDPKLANIPVVIMTADGQVKEKMAKASCSVYLRKPLELDEFLRVVSDQLDKG